MGLKLKQGVRRCVDYPRAVGRFFKGVSIPFIVLILAISSLLPLLTMTQTQAAQLTSRSLTLSSAVASATNVIYTYGFTYVSSASAIQSIKFEACTTVVGTCTAPTGMNINQGTQQGTLGGSWTNTTSFTRTGGSGSCTAANNVLCITRTQAAAESAAAKTVAWNTQTNPSTVNTAFFVRITLYSDTGWTTSTDTGTVASAIVQTLTVSARVAEVLNFCVGSTAVNDATTSVAGDCTTVSGTSLNLGVLDSSRVNISPVTSTNGGDLNNGVAMVRTNASNGVTVYYDAVQAGSGTNHLGTLRISGASCNAGTVNTDGCINAQGTTQATFTAGSEKFGMTVAATNCGSNGGTNYTCTFSSGNYNLVRNASYDGDGTNAASNFSDTDTTSGTTTNGYAWDETGTAQPIAASSNPNGFVEDEALILKFAAGIALVAPFGSYSVQADFVAVPVY